MFVKNKILWIVNIIMFVVVIWITTYDHTRIKCPICNRSNIHFIEVGCREFMFCDECNIQILE